MRKIFVIGNIGCGKSTFCKMLEEELTKLGRAVANVNLDKIAIGISKNSEIIEQIKETFGDYETREDLARIVFKSKDALEKLNKIMHPIIYEQMLENFKNYEEMGTDYVIVEETAYQGKNDRFARHAVPKFAVIQRLVDKINSHMREFLDGMLVIRAFNREDLEEKKFDETNSTLTSIDRRISKLMAIAMPLMQFVMNSIAVAIIWFSAKQIDINVISVGDMMAFIQYSMHVVISFMLVSVTFFMVPRALVSVKRIKEVMDTEVSIYDKEDTKQLPKENGDFEFDNVTFKYPGAEENVLENISFTAKPGETVAFKRKMFYFQLVHIVYVQ